MEGKNISQQTQKRLFSKTDFKNQQCEYKSCPVKVTQVSSITLPRFCTEM